MDSTPPSQDFPFGQETNETERAFVRIGGGLMDSQTADLIDPSDTSADDVPLTGLSNTQRIAQLLEINRRKREREEALLDQQERELEATQAELEREKTDTKALEDLKAAEEAAAKDRVLRAQRLREQKALLEQEQRLLAHRRNAIEKGNPGTGTDVWGKKAFMDVDGKQFSVRDVKVASQEAMESLFSRRVTDAGRHKELYGLEGLTLDTALISTRITQRGTLQLFGIRTVDATFWASPTKYDKVSHLPVMSTGGTAVFHKGFCTDLRWFLPSSWGQSRLYTESSWHWNIWSWFTWSRHLWNSKA